MQSINAVAKRPRKTAVFIALHNASFKCDVNINGTHEHVEVLRWQLPLIHGMLHTAYAAQGLTLHGGVVVDLRRAGGLGDDDWWLAIYVMLSRAQQLTNLILVGFTEQAFLFNSACAKVPVRTTNSHAQSISPAYCRSKRVDDHSRFYANFRDFRGARVSTLTPHVLKPNADPVVLT